MKKINLNSHFTAIYKNNNSIHILKAFIVDENKLYVQFYNKTNSVLLPVFEINAGYWNLFKTENPTTKNFNRKKLIDCFKNYEFLYLSKIYQF